MIYIYKAHLFSPDACTCHPYIHSIFPKWFFHLLLQLLCKSCTIECCRPTQSSYMYLMITSATCASRYGRIKFWLPSNFHVENYTSHDVGYNEGYYGGDTETPEVADGAKAIQMTVKNYHLPFPHSQTLVIRCSYKSSILINKCDSVHCS